MAKRKEHLPVRPVGKKRQTKAMLAWGGFVDGKLYEWLSGFYLVEHLSVFRTKRDAMRCCKDVRRVKIEVVE